MKREARRIIVAGGGTAGAVLAARVSESPGVSVTLLEAGPDHDAYDAAVLEPAPASGAWAWNDVVSTFIAAERDADFGASPIQGRSGLRVVEASVMPTIPSGNTYLGCVMVAERVSQKMAARAGAMGVGSVGP